MGEKINGGGWSGLLSSKINSFIAYEWRDWNFGHGQNMSYHLSISICYVRKKIKSKTELPKNFEPE
jgi:hypothetical protein